MDRRSCGNQLRTKCRMNDSQLVIRLVVDCNKISRFARFLANDLCGSITIFRVPLFRVFPTVKPINKACCNHIKLINLGSSC